MLQSFNNLKEQVSICDCNVFKKTTLNTTQQYYSPLYCDMTTSSAKCLKSKLNKLFYATDNIFDIDYKSFLIGHKFFTHKVT